MSAIIDEGMLRSTMNKSNNGLSSSDIETATEVLSKNESKSERCVCLAENISRDFTI